MALDRPVKRDMAMTGEVCSCESQGPQGLCFRSARSFAQVTLTGKVLRVGGIKEMLGVEMNDCRGLVPRAAILTVLVSLDVFERLDKTKVAALKVAAAQEDAGCQKREC